MKEKVAAAIAAGDHGSTFAGNPFVCRAALTVMDRVEDPAFIANVNARGEQLREGLKKASAGNPHVKEVRGTISFKFNVPRKRVVTYICGGTGGRRCSCNSK
eukprot:8738217-Pyramimonas_sp.AAC.1